MHVEGLEDRRLFAGNVTATMVNGLLTVRGDDAENYILIRRELEGTNTVIEPGGDTQVNGGPAGASVTFAGAPVNGMDIDLGKGSDDLFIRRLRAGGETRIVVGAPQELFSHKNVSVTDSRLSKLTIDAEPEAPPTINRQRTVVAVHRSVISGTVSIAFANGMDDVLGMRGTTVGNGVVVRKSSSPGLRATFSGVNILGSSTISTAGGADKIELLGSIFDTLSVRTRGGDDLIDERAMQYRTASSVDPGPGRNRHGRSISLGWNFSKYTQRWEPGIVSEQFVPPFVPTNSEMLDFLGVEAGIQQGGYAFSSADDLSQDYVFLQRRLNGGNGLHVGQKYRLRVEVTTVAQHIVRIGATPFHQQPVLDPEAATGEVMLNTRSTDLSEVPFDIDDGSGVYVHTHPTPVMTDDRGFLWLHVGAMRNAGASAGTPPLSFYSVQVTLVPFA